MTKYNPENKDVLTYGEALNPAMEITDQADADQYFEAMVIHHMKHQKVPLRSKAVETCRCNLAYYAGYYNNETRERVERLFVAAHPVFGKIADGVPTTDYCLKAGIEYGRKFRNTQK